MRLWLEENVVEEPVRLHQGKGETEQHYPSYIESGLSDPAHIFQGYLGSTPVLLIGRIQNDQIVAKYHFIELINLFVNNHVPFVSSKNRIRIRIFSNCRKLIKVLIDKQKYL